MDCTIRAFLRPIHYARRSGVAKLSHRLMQRHGQEIYSPVLPLSELTPLDLIGPILMINPFADSVALFTDGPAQARRHRLAQQSDCQKLFGLHVG